MTFDEHEMVRLRRPVEGCPIAAGTVGAVVMVHEPGKAYEVEFCDECGVTLALLTLSAEDLEGCIGARR